MKIPEWSTDIELGIAIVDEDHRAFYDLADLLQKNEIKDENFIKSCLNILSEFVNGHFHREEKAMKKVKYPHYEVHKRQHELFRTRINLLIEEYNKGRLEVANDLPELVVKWLINHIMVEDKKYRYWIDAYLDTRPLVFLAMEYESQHQNLG